MSYNIEKTNLAEGLLEQVDTEPRYPLGFRTHDADGREYVYVKALADLTAGTAVAGVARSALTVTPGSVSSGYFQVTAATPALATTTFNANELKGTLIEIVDANGTGRGIYPITDASYDGVNYALTCPEIKNGDTVSFANGAPVVAAGGVSSTEGGAINCTPISDIPEGKYGFVLPTTVANGASTDNNAGAHNITRGRDLTSLYTIEELSAKVQAGDFSDIYVGDYITKKVKVGSYQERELDFVIAGFDYFLGMGDTELTTHHLVMVPDTAFYETIKMNDANTTTGGYYGSQAHGIASAAYTAGTGGALTNVDADYEMFLHSTLEPDDGTYTFVRNSSGKWKLNSEDVGAALNAYGITYTGTPVVGDTIAVTFAKGYLEPYRQAIYAAFGEGHILNHREYMSTSTSSAAWHDARVELMNESMVYGQMIRANNAMGDMFAKSQLPLFRNEPNRAVPRRGKGGVRNHAWLSSIYSGAGFCGVSLSGLAYYYNASLSFVVRPYFLFA